MFTVIKRDTKLIFDPDCWYHGYGNMDRIVWKFTKEYFYIFLMCLVNKNENRVNFSYSDKIMAYFDIFVKSNAMISKKSASNSKLSLTFSLSKLSRQRVALTSENLTSTSLSTLTCLPTSLSTFTPYVSNNSEH